MTDKLLLETIDWHNECTALLSAGIFRMPPQPTEADVLEDEIEDEDE